MSGIFGCRENGDGLVGCFFWALDGDVFVGGRLMDWI